MNGPTARELATHHVWVLGGTQVGKTFFEERLATSKAAPPHVIFWDGKGNAKLPGFHVMREPTSFNASLLDKHPRIRIVPPLGSVGARRKLAAEVSMKVLRMAATLAEHHKDRLQAQGYWPFLAVLWDEAGADTYASETVGPLPDLATRGLGLGVALHAMAQTPSGLSAHIMNNTQYGLLFSLGGQAGEALQSNHKIPVPTDVEAWVETPGSLPSGTAGNYAVWVKAEANAPGGPWHKMRPVKR